MSDFDSGTATAPASGEPTSEQASVDERRNKAPGWYRNPKDPNTVRWWTGEAWHGEPQRPDAWLSSRGEPIAERAYAPVENEADTGSRSDLDADGVFTRPASDEPTQVSADERRYWPFLVGGGLAVVAPFFSWVHVVILGSLNQFQLLNAVGASELWALVPLGLGLWAAIQGERRGRRAARLALLAGIAIIAADGLMLLALKHDVGQTYGLASTGLGPWLGIACGLTLAISGGRNLRAGA